MNQHQENNSSRNAMHIRVNVHSATLGFCLGGLLLLTYQVISPFLLSVGWAVILVYVTWPLFLQLNGLLGRRNTLSALLMTLMLSAVIVLPLTWISLLLKNEIAIFFREFLPHWLETKPALPEFARRIPLLEQELARILDQLDDVQALLRQRLLPWLQKNSSKVFDIIENAGLIAVNLGITLLTVFFFYRDGYGAMRQVRKGMQQLLGARIEHYLSTAKGTVKAVIYGILLAAIAQAIMAAVGYWLVGIRAPILLGAVTLFFALIPFGAPLVWGTLSIWLLLSGEYWAGISLAAWGILVVSWIDNIVRPLVIMGATRIPFLLVLFGVFGGLGSFGFIGLFLGPVILALSLSVWREWVPRENT